jgi:hypothetical protein
MGHSVELQSDQIARLFAAGAVAIPPSFPQPGIVSVELEGIKVNDKKEPSIHIRHYRTPTNLTTYIVSLREVAAIHLSEGLTSGDEPVWLLGDELRGGVARESLERLKSGRPGTVFVSEQAGVITLQECVYTAGEIAAMPLSCT